MSMNVGSSDGDEDRVVSEINTTPLVDVMLVLLIIFLITIPVVTTSVKVALPKLSNQAQETKAEDVIISVNAAGDIFWYDTKMKNIDDLSARLKKSIKPNLPIDQQAAVKIRGDSAATYDGVGRVLFACLSAGIAKVGFLTEPLAPGS
jgi:biopolymer transport protein ExbD